MELAARVAGLEQDLGYVALVLGRSCASSTRRVRTRDDVKAGIARLDELERMKDGSSTSRCCATCRDRKLEWSSPDSGSARSPRL